MEGLTEDQFKETLIKQGIYQELMKHVVLRSEYEELKSNKTPDLINLRKKIERQKEEISSLKIQIEKEQIAKQLAVSNLEFYQSKYVFFEAALFQEYVFGDRLPFFKKVYDFLKSNNVYKSTFGDFCYSIQNNSSERKLNFSLINSKLSRDDLGYFLSCLGNFYEYKYLEYKKWLKNRVIIEVEKNGYMDTTQFKRHIRDYESAINKPQMKEKIDKLFSQII
ncbi:hypothetical protein [Leeuwenhoekiella nanhaiensis]|uniref:Uncharacterized protein n=1 Tax=Leeuwenhoekiella nanhaiensis TaxID=1655491 RepID=A0A2G1VQA9_9FLAO|nr:hypothetical protein [Leeuwenhoekiella nanhaiensis]PHQ28800.1 hypothetical protein CJ305_13360 [Leeuwenhoekiella nanhaiensis]